MVDDEFGGRSYGDDDNEDGEPRLVHDFLRRDFVVSKFAIYLPATTLELLLAMDCYSTRGRVGHTVNQVWFSVQRSNYGLGLNFCAKRFEFSLN
ncbi:hypothetical protein TIFTF001_036375 [Ficus carica]|uniref:Uncharacterized protein n=1 Tax=Ficus carica TaxID=3494 RepID=A0AA88JB52_FICCA|nr:hypothetical protein TIFTF001_036365 [Ficus carica]GMN67312.1 hypothetical protein TIFTF001_036375 [Ficus carica]